MGYSLEKSSPLQKSIVVDIGGGGSKDQHDKQISKSSLVVAISKPTSTNKSNNDTISSSSNNMDDDDDTKQHKHSIPHKVHAPLLEQLASMAEKEVYSVERELGPSAFFNNGSSTTTSSGGSTPSSNSNDSIINNSTNLWTSSSVNDNSYNKKNVKKKVEGIAKIEKKDDESGSNPRRLSMVTPSENGSHVSLVNAISSGDNGSNKDNILIDDKDDTKVAESEKDREEKVVLNDSEESSTHRKELVKLQGEEDKSSSPSSGDKNESKEEGDTEQVNDTTNAISSQKGINHHASALPSQPYTYHMHGPLPPGYHHYHHQAMPPPHHQHLYHPYQYYPYTYHAHQPLPSSMTANPKEDVNDTQQKQSIQAPKEQDEKNVEDSSQPSEEKKKLPLKKRKLGELTDDSNNKQEADTSAHLQLSREEKSSSDMPEKKKLKSDETDADEKQKYGYPQHAYLPVYHHPYGGYYQQPGHTLPHSSTASPFPQILHSPHAYHQWSPSRHVARPTTESTPKISNRSSQSLSKDMSSCQASIQFQKVEKVTNASSVKKKKIHLSLKEGVDKEEKETKKTPTLSLSQTSTSIVSTKGRERCILMTTIAYRSIKGTDTQAAADVTPPPLPPYQELVNYPQYLSDSKAGQKQQKMLALKNMTKNEHDEGGKEDSTRHCVMCGTCCVYATTNKKVQLSLQPKPSNSSSDEDTTSISAGINTVSSSLSSPDTVTTKQQHYTYTIPRQNKGLCTSCDVKVWLYTDDTKPQVPIKWCKGCKNFRTWPLAFGSKVKATKCTKCRDKQRISYSSSKEKKAKK